MQALGRDNELKTAYPLPERAPPVRMELALDDGYITSVYVWRPAEGASRLPVLYVHGIQSHPGWFVGSAAALRQEGFAVYQVTRRGSGENTARRGDAHSAGQLLDDVQAAVRFVLSHSRCDRLGLLGVSWGGKLLAAYAARTEARSSLASLTLVAPGIVPRVGVSAGVKAAIGLCLLCARRRTFAIPLSEPRLFTNNETMQAYLRSDGHRLRRATARFLYASRRLDRMLQRAPAGALGVPTALLLAGRDRIIDNVATRKVLDRLTAGTLDVRQLDACHTMDFEPDPSAFYVALAEAIAGRE